MTGKTITVTLTMEDWYIVLDGLGSYVTEQTKEHPEVDRLYDELKQIIESEE